MVLLNQHCSEPDGKKETLKKGLNNTVLNEEPFEKIKSGSKDIEVWLYVTLIL